MKALAAITGLIFLLVYPALAEEDNPKIVGEWSQVFSTPLVPVAAANLPDGRVVYWSAFHRFKFRGPTGQTATAIFDPLTGESTEAIIQHTDHDMFCPGTAILEDGRIMITGGSDARSVTMYNPTTNEWTKEPQMIVTRGYHSMTVLHDGSVFTVGGSWSGGKGGKYGEVWNPEKKAWHPLMGITPETMLTNDIEGIYRSDNHMWLFQSPKASRILQAGPSKNMHWIRMRKRQGRGRVYESISRGNDTDAMNGNAVLYDIGKILTVGGAENYSYGRASNSAHVIDMNGKGDPDVHRVSDMNFNRSFCSSMVLPSGEVVTVGGQSHVQLFSDSDAILPAEIWNPETEEWSVMASHQVPRTYHSVGLLLKTGQVLVGGGGLCGGGCNANHADFEIFSPPYLFDASGRRATRPVITKFPLSVRPGGGLLRVTMDTSGNHTFALVRLSAATHAINNDMRRIPLSVKSVKPSKRLFRLKVPANAAIVPPGDYFLFAMNEDGVPSIAETIRVLKKDNARFKPMPEQPIMPRCRRLRNDMSYRLISRSSDKALSVEGNSQQGGASIVLTPLNEEHDNEFFIRRAPNDHYHIIGLHSLLAIAVNNSSTEEGAGIVQSPRVPSNHLDWCFLDIGGGFYKIMNFGSMKALSFEGDSEVVQQEPDRHTLEQEWRLENVQTL